MDCFCIWRWIVHCFFTAGFLFVYCKILFALFSKNKNLTKPKLVSTTTKFFKYTPLELISARPKQEHSLTLNNGLSAPLDSHGRLHIVHTRHLPQLTNSSSTSCYPTRHSQHYHQRHYFQNNNYSINRRKEPPQETPIFHVSLEGQRQYSDHTIQSRESSSSLQMYDGTTPTAAFIPLASHYKLLPSSSNTRLIEPNHYNPVTNSTTATALKVIPQFNKNTNEPCNSTTTMLMDRHDIPENLQQISSSTLINQQAHQKKKVLQQVPLYECNQELLNLNELTYVSLLEDDKTTYHADTNNNSQLVSGCCISHPPKTFLNEKTTQRCLIPCQPQQQYQQEQKYQQKQQYQQHQHQGEFVITPSADIIKKKKNSVSINKKEETNNKFQSNNNNNNKIALGNPLDLLLSSQLHSLSRHSDDSSSNLNNITSNTTCCFITTNPNNIKNSSSNHFTQTIRELAAIVGSPSHKDHQDVCMIKKNDSGGATQALPFHHHLLFRNSTGQQCTNNDEKHFLNNSRIIHSELDFTPSSTYRHHNTPCSLDNPAVTQIHTDTTAALKELMTTGENTLTIEPCLEASKILTPTSSSSSHNSSRHLVNWIQQQGQQPNMITSSKPFNSNTHNTLSKEKEKNNVSTNLVEEKKKKKKSSSCEISSINEHAHVKNIQDHEEQQQDLLQVIINFKFLQRVFQDCLEKKKKKINLIKSNDKQEITKNNSNRTLPALETLVSMFHNNNSAYFISKELNKQVNLEAQRIFKGAELLKRSEVFEDLQTILEFFGVEINQHTAHQMQATADTCGLSPHKSCEKTCRSQTNPNPNYDSEHENPVSSLISGLSETNQLIHEHQHQICQQGCVKDATLQTKTMMTIK